MFFTTCSLFLGLCFDDGAPVGAFFCFLAPTLFLSFGSWGVEEGKKKKIKLVFWWCLAHADWLITKTMAYTTQIVSSFSV